jgi:hypothetical protein
MIDVKTARLYAAIRIDKALRAPAALQRSCAGSSNTDLFMTNDNRLHGKHVKRIQFIVPLDLAPV